MSLNSFNHTPNQRFGKFCQAQSQFLSEFNNKPALIHGLSPTRSPCWHFLNWVKAGNLWTLEQWWNMERIFCFASVALPKCSFGTANKLLKIVVLTNRWGDRPPNHICDRLLPGFQIWTGNQLETFKQSFINPFRKVPLKLTQLSKIWYFSI